MSETIEKAIANELDQEEAETSELAAKVIVESLTDADLEQAVDVHMEAYHDKSSGRIGRSYAREFLRWFSRQKDAVAIVAKYRGEVLGYVVGAPVGYQRRLNRDLLGIVFWNVLVRPQVWLSQTIVTNIWSRFLVLMGASTPESLPPELPLPLMSLVGTAVASRARGVGVGFALYKFFEEEVRRFGIMKSIRATVHRDNIPATKVHTRLGWSAWRENKSGYVSWFKVL